MGRKNSFTVIFFLVSLIFLAVAALNGAAARQTREMEVVQMARVVAAGTMMSIKSESFGMNEYIPVEFSCKGRDKSPPLLVENVPRGAKSLALIMDDPDAPAGTWVHWVLWDIPPGTRKIEAGSAPAGAVPGVNSWGKPGYGGPCPPSGVHRYFFKLYALDTRLSLGRGAGKRELEAAMRGHIIARAELLGLFKK
ncbi:MAG: YbhB/YbcL family Raf kinase inhibitor-like protein [Nitrospiraceae bacterium]|nr:YbhB/YbcL family Raf kinase inhibitor-like protein [Nitrospiraceae bacterium]